MLGLCGLAGADTFQTTCVGGAVTPILPTALTKHHSVVAIVNQDPSNTIIYFCHGPTAPSMANNPACSATTGIRINVNANIVDSESTSGQYYCYAASDAKIGVIVAP